MHALSKCAMTVIRATLRAEDIINSEALHGNCHLDPICFISLLSEYPM